MSLQEFVHIMVCLKNIIRTWVDTHISNFKIYIWGGRSGKNCKFVGIPIIHLLSGSRLVIGDDCRFRSGKKDNYIGLATPCIFQQLFVGLKLKSAMSGEFRGCYWCREKDNNR